MRNIRNTEKKKNLMMGFKKVKKQKKTTLKIKGKAS